MKMPNQYEIFTPNGHPVYTYVSRMLKDKAGNEYAPESKLKNALKIPGRVVSIAGPSKSGKTALVEKVIGKDNLIKLSGSQIKNPEDLWSLAAQELGIPKEQKNTIKEGTKETQKVEMKCVAGIPGSVKVAAGYSQEESLDNQSELQHTHDLYSYAKVIEIIKNNGKIIFLDDFHYMSEETQKKVAEQIKNAAEKDFIRFCIAQVRHKRDLVVRKNPDLTGRLVNIDFDLWELADIKKIATGFTLMGAQVRDSVINAFAQEAGGSPQIMQEICLALTLSEKFAECKEREVEISLSLDEIDELISACIDSIDRDRILSRLEEGPASHGKERKEYEIITGEKVDVYGCIVTAIALNPPWLEITKAQLIDRVSFIVTGQKPTSTSIEKSIRHMEKIAQEFDDFNDYLEWDEDKGLQITDPYLLFFTRWKKEYRERRKAFTLRNKI